MEIPDAGWNALRDCVAAVCCTAMFIAFVYCGTRNGDKS